MIEVECTATKCSDNRNKQCTRDKIKLLDMGKDAVCFYHNTSKKN